MVDRRHVGTLHLRVPAREVVSRAERLFREALRTARFPGDGAPGVLYIRALDIGAVALDRHPAVLAAALEAQVAAAAARAVRFESPGLDAADAVLARDPLEPLALLLQRACAGCPPRSWPFTQVLPGYHPGAPPSTVIKKAVAALLAKAHGAEGLAAAFGLLLEDENAEPLLASLSAGDGSALLRAFSWPLSLSPWPSRPRGSDRPELPKTWRRALEPWLRRWGREDTRSLWAAGVALRALRPYRPRSSWAEDAVLLSQDLAAPSRAPAAPGPTPEEAARSIHPPSEAEPSEPSGVLLDPRPSPEVDRAARGPEPTVDGRPGNVEPRARDPRERKPPTEDAPAPAEAPAPEAEAHPGAASAPVLPALAGPSSTRARRRAHEIGPRDGWALVERPECTGHAGLFFLIPVLESLGIRAFLEAHPALAEAELPVRILEAALDRVGAGVEDPMRVPLRDPYGARPPISDMGLSVPEAWSSLLGERPEAMGPRDRSSATLEAESTEHPACALWLNAAERWLARFTELDLRGLVGRPGALVCTRTHLDVLFDLEDADVRVRRAALDVDPGWVPWLGRVVRYHFLRGGVL